MLSSTCEVRCDKLTFQMSLILVVLKYKKKPSKNQAHVQNEKQPR